MVHVLFVCLGNICRSPMAEAVFRHLVAERGLADKIKVDSAGTGDWHQGNEPHHGTRNVLDQNCISYEGIVARRLKSSDFEDFHYIVCMDDDNVVNAKSFQIGKSNSMLCKLMDFVNETTIKNVPDPYFTGNFEEVYQLIQSGCQSLLSYICEKENIA